MPTALLAAVTCTALLAAVLPAVRHRIQQYRAEHARRTAGEHRRRQLVNAADWAITTAVRVSLAEPATDLSVERPLQVSVADVVDRAAADFNLQVSRLEAAAMLRHRLEFRGHARGPT